MLHIVALDNVYEIDIASHENMMTSSNGNIFRVIQIQIQIQKYFIASCLTISSVHNNSQWYNTSSTFDPTWVYNSDITSRKHRMSTLYLSLQFKSK